MKIQLLHGNPKVMTKKEGHQSEHTLILSEKSRKAYNGPTKSGRIDGRGINSTHDEDCPGVIKVLSVLVDIKSVCCFTQKCGT